MLRKHLLPLAGLLFLFGISTAVAQFEGQIVFDSYDVAENGTRQQNDQFTMYVTKDRILLEGEKKYNLMGSIKTEGILVRLDFEDFVFLNGEETALKISRKDITSMMNMFGSGSTNGNRNAVNEEINYEKTGENKTLKGYECEKFIFRDEEDPNEHAVVWMTRDLGINWGMLSESWGDNELNMLGDDLSFDLIFKDGYFPLMMEAYQSGELTGVTEASRISQSNIARAMVQIPSGVKVLSFQDYLFSKMSEQ